MTVVQFSVVGDPAAQGSKTPGVNKHTGKAFMMEGQTKEARAKFKSWRSAVTEAAVEQLKVHGQFPEGPLAIAINFHFSMPANRRKKRALAMATGMGAVLFRWKWKAPDLDKLCRSTFDALTASGLILDDSRICFVEARKYEQTGTLGAHIRLWDLTDEEML